MAEALRYSFFPFLSGNSEDVSKYSQTVKNMENKYQSHYRQRFEIEFVQMNHHIQNEEFSLAQSCYHVLKEYLKKMMGDQDFARHEQELTEAYITSFVGSKNFEEALKICRRFRQKSESIRTFTKYVKSLKIWTNRFSERTPEIWEKMSDVYDSIFKLKRRAIYAIEEALKLTQNSTKRADFQLSLAALNEELKRYSTSLDCYQKAEKISRDVEEGIHESCTIGILRVSLILDHSSISRNVIDQAMVYISDDPELKHKLTSIDDSNVESVCDALEAYKASPNEEPEWEYEMSSSEEEHEQEEVKRKKSRQATKVNQLGNILILP